MTTLLREGKFYSTKISSLVHSCNIQLVDQFRSASAFDYVIMSYQDCSRKVHAIVIESCVMGRALTKLHGH